MKIRAKQEGDRERAQQRKNWKNRMRYVTSNEHNKRKINFKWQDLILRGYSGSDVIQKIMKKKFNFFGDLVGQ